MFVPPAQRVTAGLGTSGQPANLAAAGRSVRRVHVDGAIARDPEALARVITDISGNLQETAMSATANPFASSILLVGVVTVNGAFQVNHFLGRPYSGWIVSRPRGPVALYEVTPQANPGRYIQLVGNAVEEIDLLVF